MDIMQMAFSALAAVFGAGTTWGVVKTRITSVEKAISDHKANTEEKLDRIDTKIDNITNHLITIAGKGAHLQK